MGSSVTGSWAAMLALANKFDIMSIGGYSSSNGAKMPQNYRSLFVENYTALVPTVPKQILGGIWTNLGCHHGRQLLELALAATCREGPTPRSTSSLKLTWRRSIWTIDSRIS